MSRIVNLKNYDLVITYSWHTNDQGICGHTFEVIEYFWILKDYFNVCILMAENTTIDDFIVAIKSKYNFTEDEIKIITNKIEFHYKPLLLMCNNILFTDGAYERIKLSNIYYKKMFLFSCGYMPITSDKNIYILQDHRIYKKAKVNSIEYVKKILFSRFKEVNTHKNQTLIYATKNCRKLSVKYYQNLLNNTNDNYIVITNEENKLTFTSPRITQIMMPVKDIFEHFNKYLYTPIDRQFDCSPRFIAECKYYNIEVQYDITYTDKGLEARQSDLEDLSKISLTKNDNIIKIISDII